MRRCASHRSARLWLVTRVCVWLHAAQMVFENPSPAYMAAREDKSVFGVNRRSINGKSTGTPATLPAWVRVQTTEYVSELRWLVECWQ
jgi:hypothetical protein